MMINVHECICIFSTLDLELSFDMHQKPSHHLRPFITLRLFIKKITFFFPIHIHSEYFIKNSKKKIMLWKKNDYIMNNSFKKIKTIPNVGDLLQYCRVINKK